MIIQPLRIMFALSVGRQVTDEDITFTLFMWHVTYRLPKGNGFVIHVNRVIQYFLLLDIWHCRQKWIIIAGRSAAPPVNRDLLRYNRRCFAVPRVFIIGFVIMGFTTKQAKVIQRILGIGTLLFLLPKSL